MTEMVTRADGDGCSGKEGFWSRVGKVFTTRSLTRRGGPSRRTYWGSDGTRTGKPGQGQGGMVAAGRGHESHNAPGLPSSEARGTPVARSARRQTARVGRTARRPGSHPAGSKGASPEAAVEAPSSGYARVASRIQGPPRATESTVRDPGAIRSVRHQCDGRAYRGG